MKATAIYKRREGEILDKKEWDINEEKKHPFFKSLSKIETFINEKAIINAVIHRDYIGAHTQLKVYTDKIILWNDGSLPNEIKI